MKTYSAWVATPTPPTLPAVLWSESQQEELSLLKDIYGVTCDLFTVAEVKRLCWWRKMLKNGRVGRG